MATPATGAADDLEARKARGAFFTPPAIAEYLTSWAIANRPDARVLDPTSGEGVFVLSAARQLRQLGCEPSQLADQVHGVDLHEPSLDSTRRLLEAEGLTASLEEADFFSLAPDGELFSSFPAFDAVVGNPPFVRYQQHIGDARRRSLHAALSQGVRLSGLASSWAALLVHAGGFLNDDGRLAMVLPAELLTVGYAEPVRQWLRRRFAAVKLVFFERRQFEDALENVVLLLAQGSGGCDAFSLYYVSDAEDLDSIKPFDEFAVTLSAEGKWTDLLLTIRERQTFKAALDKHFVRLSEYGAPELGTVTGANPFFTLNEETRVRYGLVPGRHVTPISPPGTRHLRGLSFTNGDWESLRDEDEAVWILHPDPEDNAQGLKEYLRVGEERGVPQAYKCQIRTPWWRPPVVPKPDLFFTYMSHRYPRLIANTAGVTFVNSMHGVRLKKDAPKIARAALPLLTLNTVTMLGAEVFGRSYGGGVLKMEPREAAQLPVPSRKHLEAAWEILRPKRARLDRELRAGNWIKVVAEVDDALLRKTLCLPDADIAKLENALFTLRKRRLSRDPSAAGPARG